MRRFFLPPWMAGTPKMQEHFSAGALTARHPENEVILAEPTAGNAGAILAAMDGGHAENAGAILGRLDGRVAENEGESFLLTPCVTCLTASRN
ncbi:MAG TPA: hypothetical protein VFI49_14140 [Rudaea sp.]|nr:hypothetical protein [Rudaea sp.]